MVIRSNRTIYQLITDRLETSKTPMTVNTLMDFSDIREEALADYGGKSRDVRIATNKLSDILGFMWRRGLLTRYPAPKESQSFARYAYTIAVANADTPAKPIQSPSRSLGKTQVGITEHNDCVEIEFDKFVILIRPK